MSRYKITKYIREVAVGTGKPSIVALVEEEGVEQPFRVMLENVVSAEEAKQRMEEYIAAREADDASREVHAERMKEEEAINSVLSELNPS